LSLSILFSQVLQGFIHLAEDEGIPGAGPGAGRGFLEVDHTHYCVDKEDFVAGEFDSSGFFHISIVSLPGVVVKCAEADNRHHFSKLGILFHIIHLCLEALEFGLVIRLIFVAGDAVDEPARLRDRWQRAAAGAMDPTRAAAAFWIVGANG
jgi:hypothetical protein